MSVQHNLSTVQTFLEGLGGGHPPEALATVFAPDLSLEIPGQSGAFPWVGRGAGREAMIAFIRDLRDLTEPLAFDVEDILANEGRAVVVGSLRTRVRRTGKVIVSPFVLIFGFTDQLVSRFQMLEDSHAVAEAAR
ncbi:nuclear transport factor 2 family protein [Brevundimonas sp.]|uniref:nuclear transport factor 2 family protein n=1 Tax=Brevundimonas sp. TaxID=1871086 RepID=UPI00179A0C66|nr:nuclear transport factor 2 family protein [Brevundimonas sp.]MBA4806914.1 nuclear transport factor 2 family protein [Brevundimonas sp.]